MQNQMEGSIQDLLAELDRRGIRLRVSGDRIVCTAAPELLTASLQSEIRRLKPELLALLGAVEPRPGTARLSRRRDSSRPAPASFGQERLWLLQQMSPESFAYNIPGAVRLSGPLDLAALERALTTIVARHEVLRTTLVLDGAHLEQLVHPPFSVRLAIRPLLQISEELRPAAVSDEVTRLAKQPFDLAVCPYWRCELLRTGAEEHVLVIVQHHIVSDGWSLGILMNELGRLYLAFVHGEESPLPELALQYGDYATWQREILKGEQFDSRLAWWKARLADLPQPLELPTDRPRPSLQTFEGTAEVLVLSRVVRSSVMSFSQEHGVTPFMTLLAAFAVLLSRYCQQADLVIGTPVGNRNHADLEQLLGFFLNTLALRIDLSDGPSFSTLVRRVRDVALEAFERHEIPFEKLVEEIQPERDLSRSPIFQVMFIMHNQPRSRLDLSDLTLGEVAFESGTAKYDLTLSATLVGERIVLALEYNTALFERATILRMLGHYRELLNDAIAEPRRAVADLAVMPAAHRRRLIVDWNQTATERPPERSVVDMIEDQMRSTPAATAVIDERQTWTYAELHAAVGDLARRLANAGIQRGDRVAVLGDRDGHLIVVLLAVLRCGAAYVPLDHSIPYDRFQQILQDADVRIVLTNERFAAQVGGTDRPVLMIGNRSVSGGVTQFPTEPDDSKIGRPTLYDVAYVIYTSGSTGHPKGVCVPHRAVANFLTAMRRQPGIHPGDQLLSVTSPTFDISVLEFFLPLTVGATVVMAGRDAALDGSQLIALIEQHQISLMQATPATWGMLLRAGWTGRDSLRALCGGEAMSRELADQLLDRCAEVWNMYGPTETTVWSTCQRVSRGSRPPTIGAPIDHTRLYVLDDRFEPLPIGVWGELYIAGEGLACNYHRRPAQTGDAFLPDPFSQVPGGRMYRTGDRARWLANQQVEFLGRRDRQIKLRGHRIELEEIEHAFKHDELVANAAVRVVGDGEARYLAAWVVPSKTQTPTADELRSRLARRIPAYMIPSRIEVCSSLPVTSSGKIDRRRLVIPSPQRPELSRPFAKTRTATEKKIAQIWQEALAIDRVGLHDNFFDLGGHSLLLAAVRERLKQEFRNDISMIDLFRYPTVADLAERLSNHGQRTG